MASTAWWVGGHTCPFTLQPTATPCPKQPSNWPKPWVKLPPNRVKTFGTQVYGITTGGKDRFGSQGATLGGAGGGAGENS